MPQIAIGSDENDLIVKPETNVNEPAALHVPERNYLNDHAVYWQARSGFFSPVSSADRRRQRLGEQMRSRAGT